MYYSSGSGRVVGRVAVTAKSRTWYFGGKVKPAAYPAYPGTINTVNPNGTEILLHDAAASSGRKRNTRLTLQEMGCHWSTATSPGNMEQLQRTLSKYVSAGVVSNHCHCLPLLCISKEPLPDAQALYTALGICTCFPRSSQPTILASPSLIAAALLFPQFLALSRCALLFERLIVGVPSVCAWHVEAVPAD